jgi:DNA-binding PadR family transcriptional regulator
MSKLDSTAETSAGATRKASIYELFVLGELMDGPHHGYLLRDILGRLLGPFRHISWGVLYPLIRQLEREGLIVPFEEDGNEQGEGGAGSKQRKQYRITEAGRERFGHMMLERGDYHADYPELFLVKLNNLDHLTSQEQLEVLGHYQEYLRTEETYLEGGRRRIIEGKLVVPQGQQPHVLEIISFRLSRVEGQIDWIEQKIARMESKEEATD